MADTFGFGAPLTASEEPDADATIPTPDGLPEAGELITKAGDVKAWMDATPPARQWIVDGMIPAGEIGRLVAPGGTGKSMVLLQLAVSVATGGINWLGFTPGQGASKVLILSAEDDTNELHRRFHAIGQGLKAAGELVHPAALSNVVPIAVRGMDLRLITTIDGAAVRDTGRVEWLVKVIEQTEAKLVIMDPQMSFYGGEENSNKDAQVWIDTLRHITERTGVTLLIVHHANKAAMNGNADGGTAARGASAFRDGCRFELNLAGMTEKDAKDHGIDVDDRGRYVRLTMPKANYAPPFQGVWLERGNGGYLSRSDIYQTRCTKSASPENHAAILELLTQRAEEGKYYSKRKFCTSFSGNERVNKVGRDTLNTALAVLIENGTLKLTPPPADSDFGTDRRPQNVLIVVHQGEELPDAKESGQPFTDEPEEDMPF